MGPGETVILILMMIVMLIMVIMVMVMVIVVIMMMMVIMMIMIIMMIEAGRQPAGRKQGHVVLAMLITIIITNLIIIAV